ncbi:MAG: sensor histidine kinase [Clostridia bacterium]|nr:sensor histidine kinase [Clostridia bacterium]
MKTELRSVAGEASRLTRLLSLFLILPAIVSLLIMLLYASIFSRSSARMEETAALRPMVSKTIPTQIWSAVSGRESYAACGAGESIDEVKVRLDALLHDNPNQLELSVARRTMETLGSYAGEISKSMAEGRPVVESEALLDEVRSVASLIEDMLNNCITAEAELLASTNRQLSRTVILIAIGEFVVLLLVVLFSESMRKRMVDLIETPIARLRETTSQLAAGDLSARIESSNVVEMKELTESVNVMADRLEDLIEQNRLKQENLKKAELRTLQAQVNPHFLYNTLDTILWQAEDENSEEVIHLTKALSDFFRISLSSGRDWITIEQEIRHLSGYLEIQQTRYRDVLRYQIDIDPEMKTGIILKLLLQPLVENAIYHGIKEHRGGGEITITGRIEGQDYLFSVRDTGNGMQKEQLEKVRKSLCEGSVMPHGTEFPGHSGGGFGLHNVDQRIRLYYGISEGLHIDSDAGGTVVWFRVPMDVNREEKS